MELITPVEASKILGVKPRTVSAWIKKNRLPGMRISEGKKNEWRINKPDLMKFLGDRANPLQRGIGDSQMA